MPKCDRVGVEFAKTAPVVATAEVVVKASPAQVWQVLNDNERWPEWFPGMTEARVTSPRWDGVGSTRHVRVGPLGVDEEMVVWEPERAWGFCATNLSVSGWVAKRLLEMVEIFPDGTGSRLVYTLALAPVPWVKPMAGRLRKRMAETWTTGLANIDQQI